MARTFFIAPYVSVTNADTGETEWAPKVNPQQANYSAVCQSRTLPNPQCLVLVAGDTSGATADNQLVSLVSDNLDTTIASLSNQVRNRIQNGLNTKGVPLTLVDYVTVRDFLQALGEYFAAPNPFDLTKLGVPGV